VAIGGGDISNDDRSYFSQRMTGRLYLSKQFTDKYSGKKKRFAYKITESEEQSIFVKVKDEILLERRQGGRHQLKALLVEDPRNINELVIQTFTAETGSPHKSAYSFRNSEIRNLYNFLRGLYEKELSTQDRVLIDDEVLDSVLLTQGQATRIVTENEDLIAEALRSSITRRDILALGYRKAQIAKFEKLLSDDLYFSKEKEEHQLRGDEAVWQRFFENNSWIMGYGLAYIFNSPLEGKKLEQIVSGATAFQKGKRIDALLKTQGAINSICLAEIKTQHSPLLRDVKDAYRGESWAISEELAGAIAQVHRTIQRSLENIRTKTEMKDNEGSPTGEVLYLYKPKAFLVIGSLKEFATKKGTNEEKYSSFEMFRRSINDIEIMTFDELFQRARFIVETSETEY